MDGGRGGGGAAGGCNAVDIDDSDLSLCFPDDKLEWVCTRYSVALIIDPDTVSFSETDGKGLPDFGQGSSPAKGDVEGCNSIISAQVVFLSRSVGRPGGQIYSTHFFRGQRNRLMLWRISHVQVHKTSRSP